ncbi:MAG: SEC-C domain-containing protein [Acidobacteria bacterium]|nr:SEC-C domain-containing protein [Acidobacteriota bacterium]
MRSQGVKETVSYSNELCPCASGEKFKKCCGA